MYNLNHPRFFADFPMRTGMPLTAARRDALEFLLTRLERDPGLRLLREAAYVLATIRWETMHTFLPLRERRINRAKFPREAARQDRYWNTGYYGRGFVQITWAENYRKVGQGLAGSVVRRAGEQIVIDAQSFVRDPDLVLHPEVSYAIAAAGMRHGWFTGKKLADYIGNNPPRTDYVNARRIINGLDRAQEIAQFAQQFELLLRAAYRPLRTR
jgi:putative chitinase